MQGLVGRTNWSLELPVRANRSESHPWFQPFRDPLCLYFDYIMLSLWYSLLSYVLGWPEINLKYKILAPRKSKMCKTHRLTHCKIIVVAFDRRLTGRKVAIILMPWSGMKSDRRQIRYVYWKKWLKGTPTMVFPRVAKKRSNNPSPNEFFLHLCNFGCSRGWRTNNEYSSR